MNTFPSRRMWVRKTCFDKEQTLILHSNNKTWNEQTQNHDIIDDSLMEVFLVDPIIAEKLFHLMNEYSKKI